MPRIQKAFRKLDAPIRLLLAYPQGCGDCGGTCCKSRGASRAGVGIPPWTREELDTVARRFTNDTPTARDTLDSFKPENMSLSRDGPPQFADCVHLMPSGSCEIEDLFGFDAKPKACRDYVVAGTGEDSCSFWRAQPGGPDYAAPAPRASPK